MKILKSMAAVIGLAGAFLNAAAQKLFEPKSNDTYRGPTPARKENLSSNERIRRERGIKTGTSGAKLLRKAAQGKLGVRS